MVSRGSKFASLIAVGDTLWVGDCGGKVSRVQTEGIAEPSTAALIYFEGYGRRGRSTLIYPVLRVSHSGSCSSCGGEGGLTKGTIDDADHRPAS
jgi:hypothetical protein